MFLSTNYNKLVKEFENNKNKKWNEWLKFEKVLDKPSKQGVVGLFSSKKDENQKYIFKMSQIINYLAYHELTIMQGLGEISGYCPHFCKGVGTILCETEPSRKSLEPFHIKSKYSIEKEVLLCEYIDKSTKFYNYIRSDKINEEILYSIIKQVLLGIDIAQKKKRFTHYDLHSNNVMIKKCNKDVVFIYKIDEENQFCVPTFGHYPIIIDFGFSYIENMENNPLWTSLAHTDVGFMSDRFDWVADPKLFLITVSDEIKTKKQTKKSKCLRRIVRNIFLPLKIELDSGWDNVDDKGAVDYVLDIFEAHNEKSTIFKDYDYYCVDVLQSMIILPLESNDYKDIGINFEIFIKEWVKIENEISNVFFNLYILKELINVAREVRPLYLNDDMREESLKIFRHKIYNAIEKVSKFCNPKNVKYEKLLCSLILLTKNIEGILYDIIESRMEEKKVEYSKMPLKNIEQIYAAIDVNISDNYVYNKNTVFIIMDCIKENFQIFEIPEDEIKNINKMKNMLRGTYVYDLYNNSIEN
jgi:hypothetical protein